MDKKSFVLGILVTIGLIAIVGIAFADSEIGDTIRGIGGTILYFWGDCSNCTGYKYPNLTNVPTNITYNDSINNFTVNQTFSQGINSKMINLTGTVQVVAQNQTNSALKPPGVWSVINFTVKEVDSHNAWNGYVFIVPIDGNYSISSGIQQFNSTAGSIFGQEIFINGIGKNRLWVSGKVTGIDGAIGSGTAVISLKVGDTVDIRSYSDVYYNVLGDSTSYLTFVNIIKIG